MKRGNLVKINSRIHNWPRGTEWGTLAIVSKIEAMIVTLVCDTGFVKELPMQLVPQYLEVVGGNEAR